MRAYTVFLYTWVDIRCITVQYVLVSVKDNNYTRSTVVARVGPTVLVVTDLKGNPRLMIFMSSERAYATYYW